MSVGSGDFKSFASGGLERDYEHTSYNTRYLARVYGEAVLSLDDDSSDTVVTQRLLWYRRRPFTSSKLFGVFHSPRSKAPGGHLSRRVRPVHNRWGKIRRSARPVFARPGN